MNSPMPFNKITCVSSIIKVDKHAGSVQPPKNKLDRTIQVLNKIKINKK
jgi:hypothetical protein